MRTDENSILTDEAQSQILCLDRMQFFYELFPYPNRPFFIKPDPKGSYESHAGFAQIIAGNHDLPPGHQINDLKLRDVRTAFAKDKKIALIGCGTDEPLLFRLLHPQNPITGFDLSQRSLLKAHYKIRWHQLKPVRFIPGDASVALKDEGLFDHIQCFGVLHHQPEPEKLLRTIAESLTPDGTLRLMIYSRNGRRLERGIQRKFIGLWERLWPSAQTQSKTAARHIRWTSFKLLCWRICLPFISNGKSNRFGYIGLSSARVADALLHPSDHPLSLREVLTWSSKYGLRLIAHRAKSYELGCLNSHASPQTPIQTLVCEEERGNICSNIVLVFKKVGSV